MNPYAPFVECDEHAGPGALRQCFGWALLIVLMPLAIIAILVRGICAAFCAALEATAESLIDGSNWMEVYEREFDQWL